MLEAILAEEDSETCMLGQQMALAFTQTLIDLAENIRVRHWPAQHDIM